MRGITTPPSPRTAVSAHTATLTCTAHGTGLSKVVWLDADDVIVSSDDVSGEDVTSYLELEDVVAVREYRCRVEFSSPDISVESELVQVSVYGS